MTTMRRLFIPALIILAMILIWTPKHQALTASGNPAEPPPPPLSKPGIPSNTSEPSAGPSFEEQLLELVNQERWNNGQLPPLKSNAALNSAAETHSTNMALRNFFAHCDLDTKTMPWDRMVAAGYTNRVSAGENIAAGYGSPSEVMNAWMNSSGHRANILSFNYRDIGLGYFHQAGDAPGIRFDDDLNCLQDASSSWGFFDYWTQDFGRQVYGFPVVINREAYQTPSRSVMLYLYGGTWAKEMRLCNAGDTWTSWQPYQTDIAWTLTGGNGQKKVYAEVRNGDTIVASNDTIQLYEPTVATHIFSGETNMVYLPLMATFSTTSGEACPAQ